MSKIKSAQRGFYDIGGNDMDTYCIDCKNKECENYNKPIYFNWGCDKYVNNVFTNADMIREMTDEELAAFLWEFDYHDVTFDDSYPGFTKAKLIKWLQSAS